MLYKRLIINGTEYFLAVAQSGKGAPTAATEGSVGVSYMDEDTGDLYKCTGAADGVYTWEPMGAGGSGEDGGYYTPGVSQPDETTVQFEFTPSRDGMPAVDPVTVELPTAPGADSGQNVTVDSEMSDASTNPVQNKVVKAYVDSKVGQGGANYANLNGLKYYAFGDSIVDMQGTLTAPETFGDTGYSKDLQNRDISGITVEGYVTAIEQRYGLVATNYGVSGGTIVAKANQMIGTDYSDVALVTIAYGVNDARTGVPLGTVNSTDISTFAGALNQILRKIYTDNPECRVLVLTPIQRLYVSDFGIATPNANGNYLIDFVNMCKAVAEKRSTRCIDMYRGCGINQTNLYYYTVEGVHPVNQGFARMIGAIIPVLDDMFAVEYEPFGVMTNTGDTEPDEPDTGGDSGEDTPPEEDVSGGSIDLTDLFTLDGYYWGYNGNLWGSGTYDGVAPILLEVGRTYTLTTIMAHDAVYAGGLVPGEGFTYAPYQFNCNKNAASIDREYEIAGSTYARVTFTFTPSEANPYVVFGKVKAADVSLCSLTYI